MTTLMELMMFICLTVHTSFSLDTTRTRADYEQLLYIKGEKDSEDWELICKMHRNKNPERKICIRKEETKLQSSFNAFYSNIQTECFRKKSEHSIFVRTKIPGIRSKVFGPECDVFNDTSIIKKITGDNNTEHADEMSMSKNKAVDVFKTGMLKDLIHICPNDPQENTNRPLKLSDNAQAVLAICSSYIKSLVTLSYACKNNISSAIRHVRFVNVSEYQYNSSTKELKKVKNRICPKRKPSMYAKFMVIVEVFFRIDSLFQFFMILSILSLFIVLMVYSCFKQLRNIPGLNNMFLAGNLMFVYIAWLSDSVRFLDGYTWCSLSGLFKHFGFLSVVLWIHICIGHMFRVFWLFRPNTGIYFKRQSVIWYAFYVKVITIICIVINIALSKNGIEVEIFISGYGGHGCFMYDPNMVKLLYHVPVQTITGINICFLVLVWIRTWWKPIIQTNTSTNRRMVIFYAIMTAVMLLKQCVGYFSNLTDQIFIFHILMFLECTYGMIFLVVFVTSTEIRWLPAYWKLTHRTRHYNDTLADSNLPPYDVDEKYKTL